MTQRERPTQEARSASEGRRTGGTPPPGPSLWEDWYRAASPEQRQEVLALAGLQGVVFAHQLPPPAASPLPPAPPALPVLLATPPGAPLGALLPHSPARVPPPGACLDPDLDPEQRLAVARALDTPDLALVQGHPGTGKSRVVAEALRQAAARGETVLLLAPTPAALARALARLTADPPLVAIRLVAPGEPAEAVAACARRFTLAERVRSYKEHTLPAARDAAREAEHVRDA